MTTQKRRKQPRDPNVERYLMLELSEKNFKATIKKMFQQAIMKSGEGNLSKEIEVMKNNQMEIKELKNN